MLCCVSKPRSVATVDSVSKPLTEDGQHRGQRLSSEIARFVDTLLGQISRDEGMPYIRVFASTCCTAAPIKQGGVRIVRAAFVRHKVLQG